MPRRARKSATQLSFGVMHKKTMEFLPIVIDGERVYAGFWKRLGAALIDMIVWVPVAYIVFKLQGISLSTAITATIFQGFFYSIYSVYFNLKYGGTLGKLAVGIRITMPDGRNIGAREALLRSSVDIVYGLIISICYVYAVTKVDIAAYLSAGYVDKGRMIFRHYPALGDYTDVLFTIWYWSEMIVLLFNKRKRALHDYIAGTVVVHKKYMHDKAL